MRHSYRRALQPPGTVAISSTIPRGPVSYLNVVVRQPRVTSEAPCSRAQPQLAR